VKWFVKTKPGRVATRLIILALVAVIVYWRFFTPKIHTASEADIASIVPADLMKAAPADKDAEDRMVKLVAAIGKYEPRTFGPVITKSKSDDERVKAADGLWSDGRLAEILKVFSSGPIHMTSTQISKVGADSGSSIGETMGDLDKIKQLQRALLESAAGYRHTGHAAQALNSMLAATTIAEKVWDIQGPLSFYMEALSLETGAMRAVGDAAQDPRTSPQDCEALLKDIPPAPIIDDYLVNSLKNEFVWEKAPRIADPYKDFKETPDESQLDAEEMTSRSDLGFKTSYDATETATELGKLFTAGIENAQKPLSQYKDVGHQIQLKAITGLPPIPDLSRFKGSSRRMEKFKFKVKTYNTDNYFGRLLISEEMSDKVLVEMSCRWRALRNAARVSLASRIYRASHGGSLPKTTSDFGPVLGVWPADPVDGQPMKYNTSREVAYSIGQNMKDDGGQVAGPLSSAKDVGLSLVVLPPSKPFMAAKQAPPGAPPPRFGGPPRGPAGRGAGR